ISKTVRKAPAATATAERRPCRSRGDNGRSKAISERGLLMTTLGRWRGFLCLVLLIGAGYRSKAPYEGKSLTELERMLRDTNPKVQAQGAYGLSRLGPGARPAVPALREALGNTDPLVRQYAALALMQIGPEAQEVIPALIEALRDTEWAVQRQAAL